jgi:hypothetical protein
VLARSGACCSRLGLSPEVLDQSTINSAFCFCLDSAVTKSLSYYYYYHYYSVLRTRHSVWIKGAACPGRAPFGLWHGGAGSCWLREATREAGKPGQGMKLPRRLDRDVQIDGNNYNKTTRRILYGMAAKGWLHLASFRQWRLPCSPLAIESSPPADCSINNGRRPSQPRQSIEECFQDSRRPRAACGAGKKRARRELAKLTSCGFAASQIATKQQKTRRELRSIVSILFRCHNVEIFNSPVVTVRKPRRLVGRPGLALESLSPLDALTVRNLEADESSKLVEPWSQDSRELSVRNNVLLGWDQPHPPAFWPPLATRALFSLFPLGRSLS